MSGNSKIKSLTFPFLDEVFLNSPLCQICEFANYGVGGVCSLLLNRRIPINFIIKESQVVSCSAHRNWIDNFEVKKKPGS